MKSLALFIAAAGMIIPVLSSANDTGFGFTIADTCMVPVYNTTFMFPDEGGKIVQAPSGQMYFVKDYLPECAGAGAGYKLISATSTEVTPVPTTPAPTPTEPTPTHHCD